MIVNQPLWAKYIKLSFESLIEQMHIRATSLSITCCIGKGCEVVESHPNEIVNQHGIHIFKETPILSEQFEQFIFLLSRMVRQLYHRYTHQQTVHLTKFKVSRLSSSCQFLLQSLVNRLPIGLKITFQHDFHHPEKEIWLMVVGN